MNQWVLKFRNNCRSQIKKRPHNYLKWLQFMRHCSPKFGLTQ